MRHLVSDEHVMIKLGLVALSKKLKESGGRIVINGDAMLEYVALIMEYDDESDQFEITYNPTKLDS